MKPFKLDEHPKIIPAFKLPDDYFENFPDRLMGNLQSKKQVRPLFPQKEWMSVAAILILTLILPVFSLLKPVEQQADLAAIEDYLNNSSYVSQYELTNLLEDSDLENMEPRLPLEAEAIEDFLTRRIYVEQYILN